MTQLSPYIRYASTGALHGPYYTERVLFDYELLLVASGVATITIGERVYHTRPGDLFLFKPKVHHSIAIEPGVVFTQPHVHFDLLEDERSALTFVNYRPLEAVPPEEMCLFRDVSAFPEIQAFPDHLYLEEPAPLRHLIEDITHIYEGQQPYYMLEAKGQMLHLLSWLLRNEHYRNHGLLQAEQTLALKVKTYLDNTTNTPLYLDDLQSLFLTNRFTIIQLFKKTYGMTPIHYHNQVRAKKAGELLHHTDMTITEISDYLGYANIHSFSRAFKRITGAAPSTVPRPGGRPSG